LLYILAIKNQQPFNQLAIKTPKSDYSSTIARLLFTFKTTSILRNDQ